MRIIFSTVLFFVFLSAANESYLWPTNASTTLTTVFGDVRPRRYHAGLDIRTYGKSGYELYAIDNGYIERLRVSSSGYGKAIYLRLDDKRIVVYAHLSEFSKEMNVFARDLQKQKGRYSVNQLLEPGKFPVKKGEIIGYTGDTGSISGPHLHFEIRNESNNPFNPLLTNLTIKDTKFPIAKNLAIIPLTARSTANAEIKPITLKLQKISTTSYSIKDPLIISGPFGFAIEVLDKIDQQPFNFGLYGIELRIDNQLTYSIQYEQFDFSEGELVYTERDYALIRSGEGKFYRLFCDKKGRKLSFRDETIYSKFFFNPGIHTFEITAFDFSGNKITINGNFEYRNEIKSPGIYEFTHKKTDYIHRVIPEYEWHQFEHGTLLNILNLPQSLDSFALSSEMNQPIHESPTLVKHDRDQSQFLFDPVNLNNLGSLFFKAANDLNHYHIPITGTVAFPGSPFKYNFRDEVIISGSGDTFYDTSFAWIKALDSIPISKGRMIAGPWEIGPDFIPFKNQMKISIPADNLNSHANDKTAIYYYNPKNQAWYFMSTQFSETDSMYSTSALSGEIFALVEELNPPKIQQIKPKLNQTYSQKNAGNIHFKIKDDLSGIDGENDVTLEINQQKVIHEYNSYRREISYTFENELNPGSNDIKIIVIDKVGNSSEITGTWDLKN